MTAQPRPHAIAWAVLLAIGALLFAQSFLRWGHPIIDLGRDLYLPSQLLEGRVLYREVLYNYGPVTPYLLAAVVAVAGDALWVFEVVGVAASLLVMLALYRIGRELSGEAAGFCAALLFLVLSFSGNTTWGANFVLPYSYAAVFGTVFALWSYYFLHRFLYAGRRPWAFAWSALFALLAVFTKLEIGVAIAGVHALAWWSHRVPARAVTATLAVAVGLAVLFLTVFSARGALEHQLFAENLAKFVQNDRVDDFFLLVANLHRPVPQLLLYGRMIAELVALAGAAALLGALPEALRKRRWAAIAAGFAAAPIAAALIWHLADFRLVGTTAIVAPVLLLVLLVRDRRDPLLLLSALVVFSSLRILLRYYPAWYGFSLCVPAYLLVVYGLGIRLAQRMPSRRVFTALLVVLALVGLARFEGQTWQRYSKMTSRLETEKGTLVDFRLGRAEAIRAFLDYLDRRPGTPARSLVVFPEGVSLNYFTGLSNPTSYYLFTPPEVPSKEVEARILSELRRAPPDLVVVNSRNLAEYGSKGFGLDYAQDIASWIKEHYILERAFPPPGVRSWRLSLWRRR